MFFFAEEKDLYVPYDNEIWLIRFLRPCKFYPESALDLIKRYYSFKVKHSDVYDGLLPSREKNIFDNDILKVLSNRDQLGRRLLILELGSKSNLTFRVIFFYYTYYNLERWKPSEVILDEVFKGAVLFLEVAMLEPTTQVCGASVIFDMDGLSLSQTTKFTPSFAKRIVDWLQVSTKNLIVI